MTARICTHPWEFACEPFRIAGNLYYVGNQDVSVHLIETEEGLILLDTAFPQTVYLLLESVRRLGFDPDQIRYLLHNHGHYDHFGGTRSIVELTDARTFLGAGDLEILTDRPELSWAPEYGVELYETFEADTPLSDGDAISLGNMEIHCLATPGHTPGTISYFFDVIEADHTYRVGIVGGPGLNTLSDQYLAQYGLPASRRQDYLDSVARQKEQKVDIFIGAHPGQNDTLGKRRQMTEQHNPFIDASAWPAFLNGLEQNATSAFGA